MNLRETPAWRAMAAMLSSWTAANLTSATAATRSRLSLLSSRRDATIASPWVVIWPGQPVAGQESGARGAGDALEALGDGDAQLGAKAARGGDRVEHRGAVGRVELVDDLLVAANQRAHCGDLLVAGGGVAARPVGELRD